MSMNAYEAAWEWTARASAHTMAAEMADMWWRRNDRLGRDTASAVHSGVVPLGGGNAFGEGTQKAYCAAG